MEYNNIPNDVIRLLKDFFEELKSNNLKQSAQRTLKTVEADLSNLPKTPINNVFVSFQYENKSYDIALSDYKVEISNYVTDFESYQAYRFLYEIEGYTDIIGDFDSFVKSYYRIQKT